MITKVGVAETKNLVKNASVTSKRALNNPYVKGKLNKARLGGNPNTNPQQTKNQKKANKKKAPCVMNTDICIKEIVEFRRRDYIAFKHFRKFGKKMKLLLKAFRAEFAFSVWPGLLSNKHLSRNCIFLNL